MFRCAVNFVAVALVLVAPAVMAQPASPAPVPPSPTVVPVAPTALFRRLLAMPQQEREQFIGSKPEQNREFLRAKVQEFLALSDAQCNARLDALDLRAQLLPLMNLPAPARTQHLAALPPSRRKVLEDRLRTWDIMPPPLRNEMLQNEPAIRFFIEMQSSGVSREDLLSRQSPQQRARLEQQFDQWSGLPPERRDQMITNFERFFGQDSEDRNKTLAALDETERARVAPVLSKLEQLPKEQRDAILDGYKKYKQLSPDEQQAFLRSAVRWQAMTEREREVWRHLVLRVRPALQPPLPPFPARSETRPPLATNP